MPSRRKIQIPELKKKIDLGLGQGWGLRAVRPGKVAQLSVPAYWADGDASAVYFQPSQMEGRVRVTDLAHTIMRYSYEHEVDSNAMHFFEGLAESNGFELERQEIWAEIDEDTELVGAVLGMVQIQAQVDGYLTQKAQESTGSGTRENFRRLVLEALRAEFREALKEGVRSPHAEGFDLEAVLEIHERKLAVAPIPSDIEAERAVANRYHWAQHDEGRRLLWFAVPRDLNTLSTKTRSRLHEAYFVQGEHYDEDAMFSKIAQLAA